MTVVGAVQFEPVYLNLDATLEKMEKIVRKAASEGTRLLVFPETCLPMYCNWPSDPFPKGHLDNSFHNYYSDYFKAADSVPGKASNFLSKVAKECNCNIVTGLVEKDLNVDGVIYNSSIVIDSKGNLIGKHRKLTPVVHELLYFAKGRKEDVRTFETGMGRVGVSICFENMLTVYKRRLGELGEEIHCALWTSPGPSKETGADLEKDVEYNRRVALARSHALEMGVFVVLSTLVTTKKHDEAALAQPSWVHVGGSLVMNPYGQIIAKAEPYVEGVATANIELSQIAESRLYWNQFGKDVPGFDL